jgi:hypothetical protein
MFIACEIGKNFHLYLQVERGFSLIQAAKLLKQLGYNNFNELERINGGNEYYKQNTNTISYYILRAGVMYLFNDYCKMISNWNTPWIFPQDNESKNIFYELIKKGCNEMDLTELIKNISHKSMRMTCLELHR